MRFKQVLATAAVGFGMMACGSSDKSSGSNNNATYPQELKKELGQMYDSYQANFETKRGLLKRMEVAHKHGTAFDINTYNPQGKEALFTAIEFDSAGLHTQIFLDVPTSYDYIMKRLKRGKDYSLDGLNLEDYKCGDANYTAYHANLSYKKGDVAPSVRKNDTATNEAELRAYAENGSLFTAGTVQCDCPEKGNAKLFAGEKIPSVAQIFTPTSKQYVPLSEATATMKDFQNNDHYKLHSITRNNREMKDGQNMTAYVVYMQPK